MSNEGAFVRHAPCPACGSSDALAIYTDHTFCFRCQAHTKGEAEAKPQPAPTPMIDIDMQPWQAPFRGIDPSLLDRYGIQQLEGHICFVYRNAGGQPVAQKFRSESKKIFWRGNVKEIQAFGAHLVLQRTTLRLQSARGRWMPLPSLLAHDSG